jgi:hypothetical protein
VFFSKEELPVQVWFFNVVRIGYNDLSTFFGCGQVYHGVILEEFASDSTWTDEENSALFDGFCQFISDDPSQTFISTVSWFFVTEGLEESLDFGLSFRKRWNDFSEFSEEILIDGHVFSCDSLECLLGGKTSEKCSQRSKSTTACVRKSSNKVKFWCLEFLGINLFDHTHECLSILPVPRNWIFVMFLSESAQGNETFVENGVFGAFFKVIKRKVSINIWEFERFFQRFEFDLDWKLHISSDTIDFIRWVVKSVTDLERELVDDSDFVNGAINWIAILLGHSLHTWDTDSISIFIRMSLFVQ